MLKADLGFLYQLGFFKKKNSHRNQRFLELHKLATCQKTEPV